MKLNQFHHHYNFRGRKGFTLIELLVVIAIVALLTAILFPVFQTVRENARRASCESNMKQISLALLQYCQDFDEQYANPQDSGDDAAGWAGPLYPFVKSINVYKCPDDPDTLLTQKKFFNAYPCSYGMNVNLVISQTSPDVPVGSIMINGAIGQINSPAKTVVLFEMMNAYAPLDQIDENGPTGFNNKYGAAYSAASPTGLGYAKPFCNNNNGNAVNGTNCLYATGVTGNGDPTVWNTVAVGGVLGLHRSGSNYAMADGHVKWLLGTKVSPGWIAADPIDTQKPKVMVNGLNRFAAGSEDGTYFVTFSPR